MDVNRKKIVVEGIYLKKVVINITVVWQKESKGVGNAKTFVVERICFQNHMILDLELLFVVQKKKVWKSLQNTF